MRRKQLLIATASLLVACGAAELAATLALGARYERGVIPRLLWLDVGQREAARGWAMRSDLQAELIGPHPPYRVAHDSRGYRQPERPIERAPGTLRVLALGDSIVYGWGIEEGARFSDLLETRLSADLGRPVEVWNLAVPGYSTDQELWTYERHGRALAPDVVLLCLALNDVVIAEAASFASLGKPRLVRDGDRWRREEAAPALVRPRAMPWLKAASRWSALAAWLRERREPLAPRPLPVPEHVPWDERGGRLVAEATVKQAAKFLDPSAPVNAALELLCERLAEDGVPLVLTSVPFNHDPYLLDSRFAPPPEGYGDTALSRAVESFATDHGARAVSCDLAFASEVARGVLLQVGDGHPNARANEVMADKLAPVLEELLRARPR